MTTARVHLANLSVKFPGSALPAVDNVSLSIAAGECFALVGESGSGKTLTAMSLLGLTPGDAQVDVASRVIAGQETRSFTEAQWRGLRGTHIGLVSQDALVSLDPLRRIEQEVGEVLEISHPRAPRKLMVRQVVEALERAAVPDPEMRLRQYPHELSGGLRQRVLIASAIAGTPDILIADEPTTALDSISQARILVLLKQLKESGIALLLVSHDIGLVGQIADRIGVMRRGELVESGPTLEILGTPEHPYTQHLLDSMPSRKKRDPSRNRAVDHQETPVIACTGLGRRHINRDGEEFVALHEVSLRVAPGTTLGVVGESGSGKTTLARILMGLEDADSGVVEFEGTPWAPAPERVRRPRRGAIQLIEQNPYDALDPRWSVATAIGEAIALDRTLRHPTARKHRLMELLEQVGLSDQLLARRPHQLSGGQRQRVAIARALARRPKVLICDEPVSALDASVQAHILLLLNTLQRNLGLSLIVISHDLGVIAQVSDDVLVLHEGCVVESGSLEAVVNHAQHPFTRELLAASPAIVA